MRLCGISCSCSLVRSTPILNRCTIRSCLLMNLVAEHNVPDNRASVHAVWQAKMHSEGQQLVHAAPSAPAPTMQQMDARVQQLARQLDATQDELTELKQQKQLLQEKVAALSAELTGHQGSMAALRDDHQYSMQAVYKVAAKYAAAENRGPNTTELSRMPVGHPRPAACKIPLLTCHCQASLPVLHRFQLEQGCSVFAMHHVLNIPQFACRCGWPPTAGTTPMAPFRPASQRRWPPSV
jgi:hypothetical protein